MNSGKYKPVVWLSIRKSGLGIFILLFVLIPFPAQAQSGTPPFRPVRVVRPFRAIITVPKRANQNAGKALNPTELVLGVRVGKESCAYPINMLTGPQREILNDRLGGKAIAATW